MGTILGVADRPPEEQARLNRQLEELMQELRVAMPGVQVLFGFLLTVPFQQRFQDVTSFQRVVYLGSLIAAAVATAFFIAPSAYHRMTFQRHERPHVIRWGTWQMIVGLVALAIAMNGAVLLVTDFLFHAELVIVTVTSLATLFFTLWFGVGLVRRLRHE